MSVVINDPLYADQWHLNLLGDIETIWAEYTGAGVTVGVYDTGVQSAHPDLDDNYDSSLLFPGYDGENPSGDDGHGTSVAGLIAAENNDIGGVGVAWGASVASVNILSPEFDNAFEEFIYFAETTAYMSTFDIINQSYGYTPEFNPSLSLAEAGSFGSTEYNMHFNAALEGRDGLGTIMVKAAGNAANNGFLQDFGIYGNAQGDSTNNWHFLVAVGAIDENGDVFSYSNFGANLLVSAGAGSVTTDLTGFAGYDTGSYTDTFGGTSAATPVVSGVIALMLEANPNLSVLDVQMILAVSASMTGSSLGEVAQGFEAGEWISVGDGTWNGGGLTYNPSYGYGAVDAFAAVRMAEAWHLFEEQRLLGEQATVTASNFSSQSIDAHQFTRVMIDVNENIEIDHVYVTLDIDHSYIGDLQVYITSPDGVQFDLLKYEGGDSAIDYAWTFGLAGFRGTTSEGEWTVTFFDSFAGLDGVVNSVELEFLGAEEDEDDTWHFTDDFLDLAAVEDNRLFIGDDDEGFDIINMAALTGDVSVTLGVDEDVRVDGDIWVTQETDGIRGIVTGDGSDQLVGSDAQNGISAGRGDDIVMGAGGADILAGDQGNDLIFGEENGGYGTFESAQIFRLFNSVFGRAPGQDGHQFWMTQLLSGSLSLLDVAERFINVPEFVATYGTTTDVAFVTRLFENILGRAPAENGLNFWVSQIEDGSRTRAEVLQSISEALENQNLTADSLETFEESSDASIFAPRIYRLFEAVFGREPAQPGFEAWADAFQNGLSFSQAVSAFISTTEFQTLYEGTDNEGFIIQLFNNVLGRDPAEAGLAAWVESLENGLSREAVVEFFVDSAEFILRTDDGLFEFMTNFGRDDTIIAGSGNNIVAGGLYSDAFVFEASDTGTTTILDWEAWDVLNFGGFGYTDATDVAAHLTQVGSVVVFEDQGTTVLFENTDIADIFETQIFVAETFLT